VADYPARCAGVKAWRRYTTWFDLPARSLHHDFAVPPSNRSCPNWEFFGVAVGRVLIEVEATLVNLRRDPACQHDAAAKSIL
jgi:hypothetical protein